MIEIIYPVDSHLVAGKRAVKYREMDRITLDRSIHGIEVDVDLEDGKQGVKINLDDVTAFELAWALLTKVSAREMLKAPYKPNADPARRLWDELKRLFPSYAAMEADG